MKLVEIKSSINKIVSYNTILQSSEGTGLGLKRWRHISSPKTENKEDWVGSHKLLSVEEEAQKVPRDALIPQSLSSFQKKFFFSILVKPCTCRILVPQPGIELWCSAARVQNPNTGLSGNPPPLFINVKQVAKSIARSWCCCCCCC